MQPNLPLSHMLKDLPDPKKLLSDEEKARRAVLLNTPTKLVPLTDEQIIENPPPWTGYNSYEGYKTFGTTTKYYHGDPGPDGVKVHAPILTDEEWAKTFEVYPVVVGTKHIKKTNRTFLIKEDRPAVLNPKDIEMMDFFNENTQAMILAYRGIRKSASLQRIVMRGCLDLQEKWVYYSSTSDKAMEFSQKIRQLFKKNPRFLREYGAVISKDGDRQDSFHFIWQEQQSSRDAGLTIGSVTGKSKMGGHPDGIAIDDVSEEKDMGSDAALNKQKNWFTKQVVPMGMGHTRIFIVGTPKDPNDVYKYIEDQEMFDIKRIPAIEVWPNNNQRLPSKKPESGRWYYTYRTSRNTGRQIVAGVANIQGGRPSFNEYNMLLWQTEGREQYYLPDNKTLDKNKMALQEMLIRLRAIGDLAFAAEMQMETVSAHTGMLSVDKLKFFLPSSLPYPELKLKQNCVAYYDQAFGDSNRADYNCVAVVSEYDDQFYVRDIILWRNNSTGPEGKCKMLLEIYRRYPELRSIGVEAGLNNQADMIYIREHIGDRIPFQERYLNNYLNTGNEETARTKITNIDFSSFNVRQINRGKAIRELNQWDARLSMGQIHINEMIEADAQHELTEELRYFPTGKHDDILDAVGGAMDMCRDGNLDRVFFERGRPDDILDLGDFTFNPW